MDTVAGAPAAEAETRAVDIAMAPPAQKEAPGVEAKAPLGPLATTTGGSPGREARSRAAERRERERVMDSEASGGGEVALEAAEAEAEEVAVLVVVAVTTLESTLRQALPAEGGKGSAATTVSFSDASPSTRFLGRDRDSRAFMELRALAACAAVGPAAAGAEVVALVPLPPCAGGWLGVGAAAMKVMKESAESVLETSLAEMATLVSAESDARAAGESAVRSGFSATPVVEFIATRGEAALARAPMAMLTLSSREEVRAAFWAVRAAAAVAFSAPAAASLTRVPPMMLDRVAMEVSAPLGLEAGGGRAATPAATNCVASAMTLAERFLPPTAALAAAPEVRLLPVVAADRAASQAGGSVRFTFALTAPTLPRESTTYASTTTP